MATAIILLQLAIVLALIFIGARVGGNRKNTLSTGYRTRYCTAVACCDVPCRKRILLPAKLPYSRSCHQLRPYRQYTHRTICYQSLIPDSRFHYKHRVYRNRLLNHSVPISPNVICGNGLYRTFSSTIEVPMLNL